MTALTNEVALRLDHTLRQQSSLLAQQIAIARLAQPQVWGMEALRAHYPAWGDDQITAAFTRHCGYVGKPGVSVVIKLDQVLRMDAILDGRITP